ncbi:MAG: twin-arginine translocation signal domain-containing protein [Chloroflexi bacterium]|nr:MAG: twin-arginine translocation signal domain-containing protein [Chloroflexota bacterium]
MGLRSAAGRPVAIARGAPTNVALLALVAIAFVTGWLAFAFATSPARWSLILHATGGFAILALLPWKSMIARRGVGRPRRGRWASVLFGALVLISMAAGLLHSTGLLVYWGPLTAMDFHVGAAIAAVPLAIWHVVARRVRIRPADMSRRNFLRGSAVLAAAAATYAGSELVVRAIPTPGAARRFTGSYEAGSFRPELMPVSSWLFDAIPHLEPTAWVLKAGGREWTSDQLANFDDRVTATLDCTGGFYSTQEWAGARLDRLIGNASGSSIRVTSATGYDRRFPIENAGSMVLATRFGGRPLDAAHGYPARLVVPDARGFWWVKWVTAIEVDDLPPWWQSPFPLQ